MTQNPEQKTPTPAPKSKMSDFRKALLWTGIPVALFIPIVPLTIVAAAITAVSYRKRSEHEISRGIWTGLALGIAGGVLVYGLSCFAIVNGINL